MHNTHTHIPKHTENQNCLYLFENVDVLLGRFAHLPKLPIDKNKEDRVEKLRLCRRIESGESWQIL